MSHTKLSLNTASLVFALYLVTPSFAAEEQPAVLSCGQSGSYSELDFWIGEWQVHTADGKLAGSNRIEKILNGCAILEHWRGDGGSAGKSLFYVWQGQWRQVWVTEMASWTGGTKEKHQVNIKPEPGVRFQGSIPLPDGNTYLDRTTLIRAEDGSVRQHIEISMDGGVSWKTSFDAIYTRSGSELAAGVTGH
jgi:hypothetical protein